MELPTEGWRERALRVVEGADPYRRVGVQICLLRWEKVAADG